MFKITRDRVGISIAAMLVGALPLSAQSSTSTSKSYVLSAIEVAAGGPASGLAFRAVASIALDAPACPASSTNFKIAGGFPAHMQSRLGSRPWYIATCPKYTPLRGGTTIEIFGDELHLGSRTTVSIGGKNAPVTSRAPDKVVATTPSSDTPGYKTAVLTNGSGASGQSRAVGYLPMMDLDKAPLSTEPFDLIYRGTQGDIVVWIFALNRLPFPVALPPYLHGGLLDASTLSVLFVAPNPSPDGVLRLPVPALGRSTPKLWLQNFALTANPGYTPGAFTNVISIF